MISFEEARKILWDAANEYKLETENIPLAQASGRICASQILAPLSVQPFDNSAMDGFAVRLDDLEKASKSQSIPLRKSGIIAAGDGVSTEAIEQGNCIHIMTGAPVPPGAEAVVPIELVEIQGENILFSSQPEKGAHIRRAGEDFQKNAPILKAGDVLGPAHILPLATLGIPEIKAFKKPKVAFLATGRELVDDLSTPLQSGQIYNSNQPHALAMLKGVGCEIKSCSTIKDTLDAFEEKLSRIMRNDIDIAISSGAVSAGEFDFVKEGLENAGAEILFHKVKLKPGKPNLLARLSNGTLYFGLPGNPAATAAGLRFFVEPAIRAMTGRTQENPIYARAMNKFSKKPGMHMLLKGRTESWEDGSITVDILDGQMSFMVSPFLNMNAWVSVAEDIAEVKAGDVVDLYPLLPA